MMIPVFLTIMAWSSQAQSVVQIPPEWNASLGSLADKIAAAAKPARTFSLDVQNISTLNAGDVSSLRQTLVADLSKLGLSIKEKAPADAQLQLTLSESAEGYVWVVEIRRGDTHDVAIVAATRGSIRKASAEEPSITLRRKLIWNEDARILDFGLVPSAVMDGASILVILEPDKISFYDYRAAGFQLNRAVAISRARPVQRDVSGRIDLPAGKAELPDAKCSGNFQHPDSVTCTSAPTPQRDAPLTQPIVVQGRSVEEYAVLGATCGEGTLTLITGQGDWTEADFIQAYGVKNQTDAASERIQFSGPILALWPDDDGKSVRAVSRNLQTGAYEASIVSVSCGD
jgi:hypothetical protein